MNSIILLLILTCVKPLKTCLNKPNHCIDNVFTLYISLSLDGFE